MRQAKNARVRTTLRTERNCKRHEDKPLIALAVLNLTLESQQVFSLRNDLLALEPVVQLLAQQIVVLDHLVYFEILKNADVCVLCTVCTS